MQSIESLIEEAEKIAEEQGIPLDEAKQQVAQENGFPTWERCFEYNGGKLSIQTITPRLLKNGLLEIFQEYSSLFVSRVCEFTEDECRHSCEADNCVEAPKRLPVVKTHGRRIRVSWESRQHMERLLDTTRVVAVKTTFGYTVNPCSANPYTWIFG